MQNGTKTSVCSDCPDLFELASGDLAVIGEDITEAVVELPLTGSCDPDERMIRIPAAQAGIADLVGFLDDASRKPVDDDEKV